MSKQLEKKQGMFLGAGTPVIKIFGVGGGGGNVVNRMVRSNVTGVEFITANTDQMALKSSLADQKIALGVKTTRGLGAGMRADVGRKAAEEQIAEIKKALAHCDLLFLAAGLGGGTGTGAVPVVAEIAREMGILTVGVVTTPFRFEGRKRAKIAEDGLQELKGHVDTLMIIPNNRLLEIASHRTTVNEAFELADDVLRQGIQGIINLVNMEGTINLDFADLRTVLSNKGNAMMGIGFGQGPSRGLDAAKAAISSPLLASRSISGATGVIINIMADKDFSLLDAEAAAEFIRGIADDSADVIFGVVYDDTKNNEVSVNVIAAGFVEDGAEPAQDRAPIHQSVLPISESEAPKKSSTPFAPQKPSAKAKQPVETDDILDLGDDMMA